MFSCPRAPAGSVVRLPTPQETPPLLLLRERNVASPRMPGLPFSYCGFFSFGGGGVPAPLVWIEKARVPLGRETESLERQRSSQGHSRENA